ncbi:Ovarian tumor otubain [Penicillium chrysogenum]|nr:Ovarian tumor otubain [Penicillium chrysogenum]
MLQRCRGDIDRAFAALLDEKTDIPFEKKAAPGIPVKPSLQASRSSSPFSTGSKRSAEDSDDSEDPRPARRTRPKKRLVSNLTLGVGISFRDEHDEVVSLNLRMNSDAEDGQATDPLPGNTNPEQSDTDGKKCRRSRRLSRQRPN